MIWVHCHIQPPITESVPIRELIPPDVLRLNFKHISFSIKLVIEELFYLPANNLYLAVYVYGR